jgi:hypothetical protein
MPVARTAASTAMQAPIVRSRVLFMDSPAWVPSWN